jgi:hypothetical protein
MRYTALLAVPFVVWPYSSADDAVQVAASLANMRVNQIKPAAELAGLPFKQMCLLTPYQTQLSGKSADIEKLNGYIRQIGYRSDEVDWALIFDHGDSIKMLTFKRSAAQDILGAQAAEPRFAGILPQHFTPAECADSEAAAFTRIEHGGRGYIVFGAASD